MSLFTLVESLYVFSKSNKNFLSKIYVGWEEWEWAERKQNNIDLKEE